VDSAGCAPKLAGAAAASAAAGRRTPIGRTRRSAGRLAGRKARDAAAVTAREPKLFWLVVLKS